MLVIFDISDFYKISLRRLIMIQQASAVRKISVNVVSFDL